MPGLIYVVWTIDLVHHIWHNFLSPKNYVIYGFLSFHHYANFTNLLAYFCSQILAQSTLNYNSQADSRMFPTFTYYTELVLAMNKCFLGSILCTAVYQIILLMTSKTYWISLKLAILGSCIRLNSKRVGQERINIQQAWAE